MSFNRYKYIDWEKLRNSNIMITGATGLIGSILSRMILSADDEFNLNIKLVLPIRNILKAKNFFGDDKRITYIVSDIANLNFDNLTIDYLIHGASYTAPRAFNEKPVEVIDVALNGTKIALQIAKKCNTKSFVYLSSMEVYGFTQDEDLLSENDIKYLNPLKVRSCYPQSKRMCETMCISYYHEFGVPIKIARLAQTFGKGVTSNDSRVFAQFARCVVEGKDIVLMTDGASRRMYIDTEDACRAILTILLSGNDGEAYNVANKSTYCSIFEMANFVINNFGKPNISVRIESNEKTSGLYPPSHKLYLDISKLEGLGWKPESDLKSMFANLFEEIRKDIV